MPETRCARIAYRTSRYAEAGSGDPRTQGASTLRPTLFMHMGMRCPPTAVGPQGPSQCRRGSVECAFVSACRRLEGVWARSAAGQPQGRHEVSSHQRRATWKGSWGRRLMDCCRGVATRSEAVLRADLSGARMLNPVGDAREPHYKITLGVTPRVTPLCGVTPGVIDYSRGVTTAKGVIARLIRCGNYSKLCVCYSLYRI